MILLLAVQPLLFVAGILLGRKLAKQAVQTEDEDDAAVARQRLAEIDADPSKLVSGPALDARLSAMTRDPDRPRVYPPAWVWLAVLAAMLALAVIDPIRCFWPVARR